MSVVEAMHDAHQAFVGWAGALGGGLRAMRRESTNWKIALIDGPNMNNLGPKGRDQRMYGAIPSLAALQDGLQAFASGLGTTLEPYHSDHEGDILGFIYGARMDAFLINPAGLNRPGAPTRDALRDTGKPFVELHFANISANRAVWPNGTVVSRDAAGVVMGMREYTYVSALFGLVSALDAGGIFA